MNRISKIVSAHTQYKFGLGITFPFPNAIILNAGTMKLNDYEKRRNIFWKDAFAIRNYAKHYTSNHKTGWHSQEGI